MEGFQTVHSDQDVGDERRLGARPQLGDEHFVRDVLARGRHLSTAQHRDRGTGNRLEPPAVPLDGVAASGEIEGHRLQAAVEHQGAGHARVVQEMPLEVPVVRAHRRFGPQVATPPRPTVRVELGDLVQDQRFRVPEPRAAHVGACARPAGAETIGRPSVHKGS